MEAMEGCDTLFMVGTNFPYTKYLPEPGQCKVVQIEADPDPGRQPHRHRRADGRRRQEGAGARCCPTLTEQDRPQFLESAQKGMDDWREQMEALESHRQRTRSSPST